MRTRPIAIFLILGLLAAMLAGCGASAQSSTDAGSGNPEEISVSAAEEATGEAVQAEEPEQSAVEGSTAEEPEEVPEDDTPKYEPVEYDLPLTDEDITYSIFANLQPFLLGFLDSYADQSCYQAWQERTGIKLEFHELSDPSAMSTQIALMAASGDYYDILFDLTQYYSGGVVKAMSDDIILDLADLAAEYAPNYMCIVTSDQEHEKAVYDDEGQMGAIYSFKDYDEPFGGPIIRQDWLNKLNLDTPKTISDWHDVLAAFKNNYNTSDAIFFNSTGQNDSASLCGTFGTAGMAGMYHDGDTVKNGLLDDSFKDYLMMVQDWYNEGLINHDFYSRSTNNYNNGIEEAVLNGQVGIYYSPANSIVDYKTMNSDPDALLVGLEEPTADDGTLNTFGKYPSYLGEKCISISTTAPEPELMVRCLDYLFSEEGQLLCNWGLEGEAFEYGPDGEPHYTELITNNPEGIPVEQWARCKYTLLDMPSLFVISRTWGNYTEDQIDAVTSKWVRPYDNSLPQLSLTADENDRYVALYVDIETYMNENVIKYIIGDLSFDDWDTFTGDLEQMGIQECIDIYQQAYDRYLAR